MNKTHALTLEVAPTDGIFAPGLHAGLSLLRAEEPLWRPVKGGTIRSVELTENPHTLTAWRRERRQARKLRSFSSTVELTSQLAVVEDISFHRTFSAVGDRWFLNGAGGERLWTRYWREQRKLNDDVQPRSAFERHFRDSQHMKRPLPVWDGPVSGLPYVLDARNLFNYYHFMAETFCHLALLAELPEFDGNIFIHCPDRAPKDFIVNFIEALFPQFSSRILFPGTRQHYARALTPFVPNFYLFQAPEEETRGLREAAPISDHWDMSLPTGPVKRTLRQNGYPRSLRLLREQALQAARHVDVSHLPKRFWFGRKSEGKRDRSIPAEAAIIDGLKARGFGVICFEDLTPLEQIAAMHQAECAISYHGAGFTNLIYANPDAQIIELGTLQSGMLRWTDFISLAHVSGCTYTLGICDGDVSIESPRPNLRGPLHRIRISEAGTRLLMAHIDKLFPC
ncbi:MAG: glycosyltransferase family 61 protein [Pseudomonadota bacterium]